MKAKDLKSKESIKFTLDDKEYELKFNMNTFCELEDVYEDINKAFEDLKKMKLKAVRALIYAAVKVEDETATLKEIGEKLGIDDLERLAIVINEGLDKSMPELEEDTLGE